MRCRETENIARAYYGKHLRTHHSDVISSRACVKNKHICSRIALRMRLRMKNNTWNSVREWLWKVGKLSWDESDENRKQRQLWIQEPFEFHELHKTRNQERWTIELRHGSDWKTVNWFNDHLAWSDEYYLAILWVEMREIHQYVRKLA